MIKPNYMCLGPPKCATTSLYHILKQHPQVEVSKFKEPHFFDYDVNYIKGFEWYINEFFDNIKENRCLGEFTPTYFIIDKVPKRIYKNFGSQIKFILILRNPVDRAYSHYLHSKRDLVDSLSFEEALSNEDLRLKDARKANNDYDYIRFSYINGGMYYKHLKNFLNYFDLNQFHIILFEDDFLKNKLVTMSNLYQFLNIKEFEINLNIKSNQSSETKYYFIKKLLNSDSYIKKIFKNVIFSSRLRNQIRNKLQFFSNKAIEKEKLDISFKNRILKQYFYDDIINLEKLINRDLSNWYK